MAGLDPAIHVLAPQRKTWMPATSAGMTAKNERPSPKAQIKGTDLSHAASLDLHGHAGICGADAAGACGPWPRDRSRVHPRGKARRARHEAATEPSGAGGAAARHSRAHANHTEDA